MIVRIPEVTSWSHEVLYPVPDQVTARRSNELAYGFNSKYIPYRVMNGTHVIFVPYHATFHGHKTLTSNHHAVECLTDINRRTVDTSSIAASLRPVATFPTGASSRSNCHHFDGYLRMKHRGTRGRDSIAFHQIGARQSAFDSCFNSDSTA